MIAVVGDDDADGQQAVLDVGQAKEVALVGIVAGFGGDGHLFVGVRVVGIVFGRRFGGRRFFLAGVCVGWKQDCHGKKRRRHGADQARCSRFEQVRVRGHAGLIMIFADAVVKRGSVWNDVNGSI